MLLTLPIPLAFKTLFELSINTLLQSMVELGRCPVVQ